MSILYLLIPASLFTAIGFLSAFVWAVKSGQYDDPHTPAMRILLDEPVVQTQNPVLNSKHF